jgi:hypothetical protein
LLRRKRNHAAAYIGIVILLTGASHIERRPDLTEQNPPNRDAHLG